MKKHVLELRPTQFSIGIREVDKRRSHLKSLRNGELHAFLHEHSVPVVISAGKDYFIVDRHHLVRACWESDLHEISIEIKADLSHLSAGEFWDVMKKSHWLHLYDQFGNGPHEPQKLPQDIRGMADDPYRSLAWAVRRKGGYQKTSEPFSEFKWGEFFRTRIVIQHGDAGFQKALEEALILCRSADCRYLPGFIGTESPAPNKTEIKSSR